MDEKSNTITKLVPAKKYVSKEKSKEAKEKQEDSASSVTPTPTGSDDVPEAEEQTGNDDVIIPDRQSDSKPPDISEEKKAADEIRNYRVSDITLGDFCNAVESTLLTTLANREAAVRKAREDRIREDKAKGIDTITPENALTKCAEYMTRIVRDCNLYNEHKSDIYKQQSMQAESVKQLGVLIGRVEKTQGVKLPKRPPFPSWACLTYLFWHWPMYAFSYMWLSKYFRRFCFLLAFFVMVVEFCIICLLAGDNRTMLYDRDKYCIVRNWSYVLEDTSAVNRFDKVDLLFEDVKFNEEKIRGLNEFISNKHEHNLKRRK